MGFPPNLFIPSVVECAVMQVAERDHPFVADFASKRPWLGKPQMMRIGWLAAAHQTRLRGNKSQMGFVTQPFGLGNRELTLVDAVRG